MKKLQVYTNNNLGTQFWELRTGLIDCVEVNQLNIELIDNAIENKAPFVLIDFYFGGSSLQDEKEMTNAVIERVKRAKHKISLFILSPFYSNCSVQKYDQNRISIIWHNYSEYFMRRLLTASKKAMIFNQSQAC